MTIKLIPCVACSRHVKQGETACPFCGSTTPVVSGPEQRLPGGLSRAALLAAVAAAGGIVLAAADCSGGTALYGGSPPFDSGNADASEAG
jgi:hypothetical protein